MNIFQCAVPTLTMVRFQGLWVIVFSLLVLRCWFLRTRLVVNTARAMGQSARHSMVWMSLATRRRDQNVTRAFVRQSGFALTKREW